MQTFRNFSRKVCGHVFHKARSTDVGGGFRQGSEKYPFGEIYFHRNLTMEPEIKVPGIPEIPNLDSPSSFRFHVKFRGSKQRKSMVFLRDFLLNRVLFGLVI